MNVKVKRHTILAVLTCLFAVSEGRAQGPGGPTYSQTLVPGVLLCRENIQVCQPNPDSVTLRFTETPAPETNADATLTVTATGDINDEPESVEVTGEGSVSLGRLFAGVSATVETESLTIPFSDLSMFADDGSVEITFTLPPPSRFGNVASLRLDSATLIYRSVH